MRIQQRCHTLACVVVISAMGCGAQSTGVPAAQPGQRDVATLQPTQPGQRDVATLQPTVTLAPARRVPNPAMVSIREGLATLNTYRYTLSVTISGPNAADRKEFTVLQETDTPKKASHSKSDSREISAASPNAESSPDESYTIGSQTCNISRDGKTFKGKLKELNLLEQDMSATFAGLADYTVSSEGAVFVAEETIDGIPVNHFSTKITRLGKDSGAVVRTNKGDYWLARDGQYLIKYVVALEIASAPQGTAQAQIMKTDVTFELSGINKPMTIAFPAICKN